MLTIKTKNGNRKVLGRPEGGFTRLKPTVLDPNDVRGLLERAKSVKQNRYTRSIRKDAVRWLKRYAPDAATTIDGKRAVTVANVTTVQDCVA